MSIDISNYLPPVPPRHEGEEATSAMLMAGREFRKYKAIGRGIEKDEDDEYFKHQRIVRQFLVYNDRLLLFHDAGTGKTRTALGFINEIVNGSLRNIYRNVVISGPSETLKKPWLDNPEVKKFQNNVIYKTHYELSTMDPRKLSSSVIILDEAHMLTSSKMITLDFDRSVDHRNAANKTNILDKYLGVWNVIQRASFCKVLVLTATPMQNTADEFFPLINLVLPMDKQVKDKNVSEERLLDLMVGRVSYVGRADEGIDIEYSMDPELVDVLTKFMFTHGVQADVIYIDETEGGEISFSVPRSDIFKMELTDGSYIVVNGNDIVENKTSESVAVLSSGQEVQGGEEYGVILVRDNKDGSNKYNIVKGWQNEYIGISIPAFLSETLKLPLETPIVESFMSPAQSLILRNKSKNENPTDEEPDIERDDRKGSGVLELRGDVIAITDNSPLDILPHSMYTASSLYFTAMCIMAASVPEGISLRGPWNSISKFEPGKNIFFSDMVDSNRGGIEKFANMLQSIGYERLPSDPAMSLGNSPRFMINPNPAQISFFNRTENWDGSKCHICLYSEKISVGVSFKDVRHIHMVPSWSPSTNTQASFRGIRAGGDVTLKSMIGNFKKRIYRHISAMSPAYSTKNDWWEGVIDRDDVYRDLGTFSDCINYDRSDLKYTVMEDAVKVTDTFIGRGFRSVPDPVVYPGYHKHAGGVLVEKDEYANSFINTTAYRLSRSIEKDVDISRIRRLYRIAAMDCDLNYNRNVLPPKYNNTELCDYQDCSYVCLPGSRGLEIIIDTADPETGDDIRWERDDWAPMSPFEKSTLEAYSSLSERMKNMVMTDITNIFSKSHQGFVSYYNLMTDLHARHPNISEGQITQIIINILFGGFVIDDIMGNRCTLRYQGDILYLLPVYEIEKLQKIEIEGSVIHSFLSPPQIEVSSGIISLNDIIRRVPSKDDLINIYNNIPVTSDPVSYVYSRPFEESVLIIEGSYLSYIQSGAENPIQTEFRKYFFQATVSDINKIFDKQKQLIKPKYPAWSGNDNSKTIYFHFLYHMHPSVTARKTISETSPVKYAVENDGFGWGTDAEQKSLYEIANSMTNQNLAELKRLSASRIEEIMREKGGEGNKYSIIGLIDNKKKFEDSKSLSYFKILREDYTKESSKDAQGQVCMTMDAAKIKKDILQPFNLNITDTRKEDICKVALEVLSRNNILY